MQCLAPHTHYASMCLPYDQCNQCTSNKDTQIFPLFPTYTFVHPGRLFIGCDTKPRDTLWNLFLCHNPLHYVQGGVLFVCV